MKMTTRIGKFKNNIQPCTRNNAKTRRSHGEEEVIDADDPMSQPPGTDVIERRKQVHDAGTSDEDSLNLVGTIKGLLKSKIEDTKVCSKLRISSVEKTTCKEDIEIRIC